MQVFISSKIKGQVDIATIVPASEFTRNFGRYGMQAQRAAVAVSSHGQITGYFIGPDECEAFRRFMESRRSFANADLPDEKLKAIGESRMDARHAYLWHHQHQAGQEEGRKNRLSVIVLAVEHQGDHATLVTVFPVTHDAPADPAAAIEIPAPVKRHVGVDEDRSWIVAAEGNRFLWPGYDPRKLPNADRYHYGFLPPRFFNQVLTAFVA